MIKSNHRAGTSAMIVVRALSAVALIVCLTAAAAAGANPEARAKQLFREGNTLYEKKDYAGAVDLFERAYKLFPTPRIELNIGLAREKMGNLPAAATHLEGFLGAISEAKYPGKVKVVRAKLDRLKKKIASVMISYQEPGAEVKIDGVQVGVTPLKRRIYRAPGDLKVSVSRPGFQVFAKELTLAAGDHRSVIVQLQPVPAPPSPATEDRTPRPDLTAAPDPEVDEHATNTPVYKKWWFWTLIGAAVVGGTVGAVVATQTGGSDRVPGGELGSIR